MPGCSEKGLEPVTLKDSSRGSRPLASPTGLGVRRQSASGDGAFRSRAQRRLAHVEFQHWASLPLQSGVALCFPPHSKTHRLITRSRPHPSHRAPHMNSTGVLGFSTSKCRTRKTRRAGSTPDGKDAPRSSPFHPLVRLWRLPRRACGKRREHPQLRRRLRPQRRQPNLASRTPIPGRDVRYATTGSH